MRNRDLFHGVVAAVAANVAVLLAATAPARAADDRADADAAFKAGQYDLAAKVYARLVDAGSKDAAVYRNLGLCYVLERRDGGFTDRIEEYFRRSVKLDDRDPLTHYHLGCHLWRHGRGREAIDEFRAVVRLDARHVDARFRLAGLLRSHDQDAGGDEAEALYKEVIRLDPGHVDAHYLLGALYVAAGRTAEALAIYEQGGKLKRRGDERDPKDLEERRAELLQGLEGRR
jgi:cytochrome c-type biogenesis protein CcmH/NrfG